MIGTRVLMAFALLPFLAHLGWRIGLRAELREGQYPFGAEWPGAALFVLAALTPLLSFRATGPIDRLRDHPRPDRWRRPALRQSLALLGLVAARAKARDVPEDRSFAMCLKPFGFWRPIPSQ